VYPDESKDLLLRNRVISACVLHIISFVLSSSLSQTCSTSAIISWLLSPLLAYASRNVLHKQIPTVLPEYQESNLKSLEYVNPGLPNERPTRIDLNWNGCSSSMVAKMQATSTI
jgi:hypothetical protein